MTELAEDSSTVQKSVVPFLKAEAEPEALCSCVEIPIRISAEPDLN